MPKQQRPVSAMIFFILFWSIVVIITFIALQTTAWNALSLAFQSLLALYTVIQFTGWEWMPFLTKPKNLIPLDGTHGICMSPLEDEGMGLVGIDVGVRPHYCPKYLWETYPAFKGMMLKLGNIVKIRVIAPPTSFYDLPSQNCQAPQGAILYFGSLDPDRKIINPIQTLMDTINQQNDLIKKIHTIAITATTQSAIDSRTANQGIREVLRGILPLIQEFIKSKEKQPPQILIPGGGA